MPKVTEASGEVTYTWNCIPGATGYKIRLISRVDGVEYAFACDSVMNGDSTLTFHKLGEQLYEAYFSVQFGYPGHYNWSQESSPVYLNLSTRPIPENSDGETRLKSGDVAIVQVNTTYNSFDFVVLKPVKAGTRIYFSDFSYSSSYHDLDRSTTLDGVYTYTAPENLPAGTVIQSLNNTSFSDSKLNFKSKLQNSYLNGQTLLAFQIREGADTTFLTNFAWARTNNFAPGTRFSKVSDIPPGLSFDSQTVMQMDSARGGNPVQNFRYNRYEGFRGTQAQILKWLSDPANYATYFGAINNDRVEPFTVLAEDTVVTGFSSNSRPLLMPSMRLHSNPVKERLCLTVVSPSSSLVTLQLVDVSGKVVLRRDVQLAVGLNDLELPIVGLSGCYLLRLDMNGKTLVNRVLVR
jgi:hypothetical protein